MRKPTMPFDENDTLYCQCCGDPCEVAAEAWDYSGTHCTHGLSGTHYTGRILSTCCDAEVDKYPPEPEDDAWVWNGSRLFPPEENV